MVFTLTDCRNMLIRELTDFVKAHHPYEVSMHRRFDYGCASEAMTQDLILMLCSQVCEVITMPITDGNPAYLKWLGDSTKDAASEL